MSRRASRRIVNGTALTGCLGFTALALWPLLSILWELGRRGAPTLSWSFLTQVPTGPFFPGGGIYNAIIGTGMVVGIGTAIGAPVGISAGIYLSEYGPNRLSALVRATADIMTGIPSIVAGLFGYAVVVSRWGFSAYAGGVALSLIMVPIVTRTTEEALRTVPRAYREAGLALGAPRWYTILTVVVPPAASAVLTGILLAVARIAGETAPLLLTVLKSNFLVTDPKQPVGTLPVTIYRYGQSAYAKENDQAWAAALVLIGMVLVLNLAVRLLLRRRRVSAS